MSKNSKINHKKELSEDKVNTRLAADHEIQNLICDVYEDYGMNGLKYVRAEFSRYIKAFKKEFRTGEIF